MAETWPKTDARQAILKLADLVGQAAVAPFRRTRNDFATDSIRRALIIEPWNIGDVVLATPVLRALRFRFPDAQISLLAKPHARTILEGSGLVDEVIAFDLPWTAAQNKYRLNAGTMGSMRQLIGMLRARNFDFTLDARMDIRSNLLAALTKARHRIGYAIGGGGWLLTESLNADRKETHKIDDWLDLLELLPVGNEPRACVRRSPFLSVSDTEVARARSRLTGNSRLTAPVIGYHPGGSHAAKRWPLPLFEQLIHELRDSLGGNQVVFLGPDDEQPSRLPEGAIVRRTTLREMMAEVNCCDVLVCNDSGPMHIADALGVPVVAIFEIGNPQWYGPSGPRATVIAGELAGLGISAAPLDRPPSRPVAVEQVREAVKASLRAASTRPSSQTD